MKQLHLLTKVPSAYGGILYRTQKGRARPRPLSTRQTMHLVLRASKATGSRSLRHGTNEGKVRAIISRFSRRHSVNVLSMANVGNHIHLHIKLKKRHTYKPFIRATTAAIAMLITGASRPRPTREKFWDYRPFTRIIEGFRAYLTLRNYISLNELEGLGYTRPQARERIYWGTHGILPQLSSSKRI